MGLRAKRHGWADTSQARCLLGWQPSLTVGEGIADPCGWLGSLPEQQIDLAVRAYENAEREAETRSVVV
jgi:hypothetical protein